MDLVCDGNQAQCLREALIEKAVRLNTYFKAEGQVHTALDEALKAWIVDVEKSPLDGT